jgi:hypothetical protein
VWIKADDAKVLASDALEAATHALEVAGAAEPVVVADHAEVAVVVPVAPEAALIAVLDGVKTAPVYELDITEAALSAVAGRPISTYTQLANERDDGTEVIWAWPTDCATDDERSALAVGITVLEDRWVRIMDVNGAVIADTNVLRDIEAAIAGRLKAQPVGEDDDTGAEASFPLSFSRHGRGGSYGTTCTFGGRTVRYEVVKDRNEWRLNDFGRATDDPAAIIWSADFKTKAGAEEAACRREAKRRASVETVAKPSSTSAEELAQDAPDAFAAVTIVEAAAGRPVSTCTEPRHDNADIIWYWPTGEDFDGNKEDVAVGVSDTPLRHQRPSRQLANHLAGCPRHGRSPQAGWSPAVRASGPGCRCAD